MSYQFTIRAHSALHFVAGVFVAVLAPIGYWWAGVYELQSGLLGLLFLYCFGMRVEINKVNISPAAIFPGAINLATWAVGVVLFFYYL